MMCVSIIPSVFNVKMKDMERNKIAEKFEFLKDDLPFQGSFVTELLYWQVS